jgi:hypothetical protein
MFVMLITYNKQHTQHETGEQYRDLGDGTGELREKERERERAGLPDGIVLNKKITILGKFYWFL